jgi:hypothetical protein
MTDAPPPSSPGPRNIPCPLPPISAIFQDLWKSVSGFPNFRAIIGSAGHTLCQEALVHGRIVGPFSIDTTAHAMPDQFQQMSASVFQKHQGKSNFRAIIGSAGHTLCQEAP